MFGCFLLATGLALASDEEMPAPEFLEYLGSWEESDAEWQIFAEPVKTEVEEERKEPAPEGEDSMEKTDES